MHRVSGPSLSAEVTQRKERADLCRGQAPRRVKRQVRQMPFEARRHAEGGGARDTDTIAGHEQRPHIPDMAYRLECWYS